MVHWRYHQIARVIFLRWYEHASRCRWSVYCSIPRIQNIMDIMVFRWCHQDRVRLCSVPGDCGGRIMTLKVIIHYNKTQSQYICKKQGCNLAIRAVYSYWLLVYWTKQIRGLTAMRNRPTLLRAEQSRAEQSRAEQSRAEHGLTVPFCVLRGAWNCILHSRWMTVGLDGVSIPCQVRRFCCV